jgi:hypothetical protein
MSIFVTYQEELVVSEVGPVILVTLIMHLTRILTTCNGMLLIYLGFFVDHWLLF